MSPPAKARNEKRHPNCTREGKSDSDRSATAPDEIQNSGRGYPGEHESPGKEPCGCPSATRECLPAAPTPPCLTSHAVNRRAGQTETLPHRPDGQLYTTSRFVASTAITPSPQLVHTSSMKTFRLRTSFK